MENATNARSRLRHMEREFIHSFWVYIVKWCFIITIYSCKRCGKYWKHQEEIEKHEKRETLDRVESGETCQKPWGEMGCCVVEKYSWTTIRQMISIVKFPLKITKVFVNFRGNIIVVWPFKTYCSLGLFKWLKRCKINNETSWLYMIKLSCKHLIM